MLVVEYQTEKEYISYQLITIIEILITICNSTVDGSIVCSEVATEGNITDTELQNSQMERGTITYMCPLVQTLRLLYTLHWTELHNINYSTL